MLVTSGYGGVYPPGLLIGTVDSVTGGESDTIRSAVVTPAADMGRLEEVFVITSQFERTLPQNIEMTAPTKEPVMNPNENRRGFHNVQMGSSNPDGLPDAGAGAGDRRAVKREMGA